MAKNDAYLLSVRVHRNTGDTRSSSTCRGEGRLPASQGTGPTPFQERACYGHTAMHWGDAEVVVNLHLIINEGDAVLVADLLAGA